MRTKPRAAGRVPKTEDVVFAHVGKHHAAALAAALLGVRRARVHLLPRDLPRVQKLECDFAVEVMSPKPVHVLHVEHWSWPGDLPTTATYHILLNRETRRPVWTKIFATHPRAAKGIPRAYSFRVGRRRPTVIPLEVVRVWRMRATEVLARRQVALYPFVPLMQDSRAPKLLLGEVKERILGDAGAEPARRNLLAAAGHIAARRFSAELVKAIFGGIAEMAKTDLGRELVNMGREEGRVEARRADVLDALEARFGPLPESIRARVNKIEDEPALGALLRRAVIAASLAEFEAAP